MTLKEYIEHLKKVIEENPQAGDFLVIYSCDDEGNSFHRVNFPPSLFCVKYPNTDYDLIFDRTGEKNSICIN